MKISSENGDHFSLPQWVNYFTTFGCQQLYGSLFTDNHYDIWLKKSLGFESNCKCVLSRIENISFAAQLFFMGSFAGPHPALETVQWFSCFYSMVCFNHGYLIFFFSRNFICRSISIIIAIREILILEIKCWYKMTVITVFTCKYRPHFLCYSLKIKLQMYILYTYISFMDCCWWRWLLTCIIGIRILTHSGIFGSSSCLERLRITSMGTGN